jgi:type III secretion system YscD/HrpQ family protein
VIGYLICEDGPLSGLTIRLDEGVEWEIGRDPSSKILLEDPMVSRKHGLIRLENGEYILDNQSEVNPIKINDEVADHHKLQEDDILQIGNNYLRFTFHAIDSLKDSEPTNTELTPPPTLPFNLSSPSRFFVKVLSGPNQGAEFGMNSNATYIFGKDSNSDIIFQDLSVSHRHAKLQIQENGEALIEDLNSRNGVVVNGLKIDTSANLASGSVVSLGTSVFVFIDKDAEEETIYSPTERFYSEAKREETKNEEAKTIITAKNWKETFIPTRHLVFASTFAFVILFGLFSLFSLFKTEEPEQHHVDASKKIEETLSKFKSLQYSYNPQNGKLFLVGHVLTETDYAELNYLVKNLPFVRNIEDNVIVDEGVWQEMNALISKNPNWRSVLMSATSPGKFVLRGYLQSEDEVSSLQDYINLNFPYLNLLENQVVVESTLQTQIQNMLIAEDFGSTELQISNGEVIISGKISEKKKEAFNNLVLKIQKLIGVRSVKNFTVPVSETSSMLDLSDKYKVMGTSKLGNLNQYVLIGGKILSIGDVLDGMTITSISNKEVMLIKDGMKFKIDYNQQ